MDTPLLLCSWQAGRSVGFQLAVLWLAERTCSRGWNEASSGAIPSCRGLSTISANMFIRQRTVEGLLKKDEDRMSNIDEIVKSPNPRHSDESRSP